FRSDDHEPVPLLHQAHRQVAEGGQRHRDERPPDRNGPERGPAPELEVLRLAEVLDPGRVGGWGRWGRVLRHRRLRGLAAGAGRRCWLGGVRSRPGRGARPGPWDQPPMLATISSWAAVSRSAGSSPPTMSAVA